MRCRCLLAPETLGLGQGHGTAAVGAWRPRPQALRVPTCPVPDCTCSSSSTAFPKGFFPFREMEKDILWKARVQGYGRETPIKWPEVLGRAGCTPRNLWKPLFLFPSLNMTKEKRRRRKRGDLGGVKEQPPQHPHTAAPRTPFAHPRLSAPRPPEPSWRDRRMVRAGPAASSVPGCQRCKSVPKPRFLYLVGDTPALRPCY